MKTSLNFLFFLRSQNRLKESTCLAYAQIADFLGDNLRNEKKLINYCVQRQEVGTQSETLNKYLKVAKWWCRYQGHNWDKKLTKFKVTKKTKATLNVQEVKQFTAISTHFVLDMFWQIHGFSGTRPAEVANLMIDDLDLDNHCFYPRSTKTNDGKPIVYFNWLTPKLLFYLQRIDGPYLFSLRPNKAISLRTIQKDCQKRLKIMHCEKRITPHSFRHTFATIGIASGKMPVQYVQRLLRHTQITTTMHYFDQSVDLMQAAALVHPYAHFQT